MGLRKQTIFLSFISTLASPFAMGLGLGEIKLKSTLNQPLYAEIQLTQTKDLTDREILVGMASAADFARVGVERPGFLGDLKFQVVMDEGRGPLVRITSTKAVVEPYLNFIVQAQWPSGKLLREYTVLVDLPTYSGDEGTSAAPPISRPATSAPKVETQINQPEAPRARVTRPAATPAPRPKVPRPAPVAETPPIEPKPSGDTYGPVAGNDTLWRIARANRPAGASIQQTMLAIQKLNPDAFINGNINLLRKGQTLRLPAADEAAQVAATDAARTVAASPPAARKAPADETSGPQLDASKSVAKTEAKTQNLEGRVKLSSSNSADSSKSGRGAGKDQGNKEALTNELTITKEELDAKTRESADLNARLKAVDEQIENTEKLIQVNSEEMLKLELAIEKNKQNAAATTPAAPEAAPATVSAPAEATPAEATPAAAITTPAVPDATPPSAEVTAPIPDASPATTEIPAAISADGKVVAPVEGQPEPGVTPPPEVGPEAPKVDGPQEVPPAAVAQEPKAETVAPAQPVAPATVEPSGIVEQLKNNALYIGAGIAALLGLGLVMLKRRRHDDDEDPAPWVSAAENKDNAWGGDFALPGFDDTKLAETKPAVQSDDTTAFQFANTSSVKLETDDVVSESDIHIALSDFGTAEKLLLSSLEQDPANSRVLLKLLEVYSRKQDVDSFDRQFAKLKAFCDPESAARAEQLRSYIENAPPFDAHKYSDEAFLAALNGKTDNEDSTQLSPALAAAGVGGLVAAASLAPEPFADFEFDARLDDADAVSGDNSIGASTADVTEFMQPSSESADDFTFDFDEPSTAPAADRKSLAELMADEGGEASLDLSDFDDLSFDTQAAPDISLDDTQPATADALADIDFSFDSPGLEESDFELDENALGDDFESIAGDELQQDVGLDAGFDDLDEPTAQTPAAEPVDEFADLDLSALDYDFADNSSAANDSHGEVAGESDFADMDFAESVLGASDKAVALDDDLAGDFLAVSAAPAGQQPGLLIDEELDANQGIRDAIAQLDTLDESARSSSAVRSSEATSTARSNLEELLDFDADFGDDFLPSGGGSPVVDEFDEPSTPTLVRPAITDLDLPSEELDFDELDADLGALAAEFDGDLSDLDDLDDLDAPKLAAASGLAMDEPVIQFGELDDVDPADILGDGPKERPQIDLEGFDDSVKFAIEDPLTDLDVEADHDHLRAESARSGTGSSLAGELGTAVNFDTSEDLVEFEDLDNLDDLGELDLDAADALALEMDDNELVIPRAHASSPEADFQLPDFDPESDDDSDLGALCDGDELDTKLDLLRAFVEMGDEDSAKHTLEEILDEGTDEQRKQARALMERMS